MNYTQLPMRALRSSTIILALTFATGCEITPTTEDAGLDATFPDATTSCPALTGGMGDRAVYQTFPLDLDQFLRNHQPDPSGLLGRNRQFGRVLSPRFQAGGGILLRFAIAAREQNFASNALKAIETGLTTLDPATGRLVPQPIPGSSATAGPEEEAAAATWFLGDACTALLTLEQAPPEWELRTRAQRLIPMITLALDWLVGRTDLLFQAHVFAPDRLMSHARAFHACGVLTHRSLALSIAQRFANAALTRQRNDGAFTTDLSHDTDVQAITLATGYDLATVDPGVCAWLLPRLSLGARWLAARVDPFGQINSLGNARSCTGGEVFLGEPRRLDVFTAFRALASLGVAIGDTEVIDAARRVGYWIRGHPNTDPCFP